MLQEVVGFLHRLGSASKDCVVVMCHVGTHEALSKALEKHSTVPPLAPALLELLMECEKYASLYKKLTSSILAGCIQVGLGRRGCAGDLGLGASGCPCCCSGMALCSLAGTALRGLRGGGHGAPGKSLAPSPSWSWDRLRSTAGATSPSASPSLMSSCTTCAKVSAGWGS